MDNSALSTQHSALGKMNGHRTYVIACGVLRDADRVLLVHQQRQGDPRPSWALPGGRVEVGELVTEALVREVREETGLAVREIGPLAYALHLVSDELNLQDLAYVFEIDAWEGEIHPDDPEGVILEACFLPLDEAIANLEQHAPWRAMGEPIVAYLNGTHPPGTMWLYRDASPEQELVSCLTPMEGRRQKAVGSVKRE